MAEKPKSSAHVSQDKETGNFIVTLNEESFSKEALALTSSGWFIDVLAISAKQYEQNDLFEYNIDNFDSTHKYILDDFDFEDAYIEALNSGKEACAPMHPRDRQKMFDSELMNGAYFALNHPDDFAKGLENYTEKIKEQSYECIGDYNTDCKDLNDELNKSYEQQQDDLYKEWLYGDHRNFSGILEEAKKYHGFEDIDYTEGKKEAPATLRIEVSEQWILDALGYADDYKVKKADAYDQVIAAVSYAAKKHTDVKRAEQLKRSEERKRVDAYRKERDAQTEKARIEKLQAMKKS